MYSKIISKIIPIFDDFFKNCVPYYPKIFLKFRAKIQNINMILLENYFQTLWILLPKHLNFNAKNFRNLPFLGFVK